MRKKHHEIDITDSTIFKLNLEKYLKNESLSLIQYLDLLSNQTTDTVTTFQGDIAVLSESNFIIKNKRKIISILNSSENFAYVGDYEGEGYNDYDDIIRYDWIEKLDVTSSKTNYLIGNNIEKQEEDIDDNELEETRRVQLNTILWLPNSSFASSSLSSNKKKKYSRKSNKNEEFVPYRVLGNLSIKGKIMNVSCMSDKLLKKCNDIINNIAGKYLIYLGDKYTELQHDTKENELDVNLKQKSKDNNMISHASEKDLYKHSNENEIPPAITKQIDGFFEKYYENWINMKIPYLDNMTPLEIINTKEGKEKIENLLRDIENEYTKSAIGDLPFFPIEKMRKRLGLD